MSAVSTRLHLVFGEGLLGKAVARQIGKRHPDDVVEVVRGLRHTDGQVFQSTLARVRSLLDRLGSGRVSHLRVWITGGRVGGAYANQRYGYAFATENLEYYLAVLRVLGGSIADCHDPKRTDIVGFGSTCQLAQSPAGLDAHSAFDVGLTDLHPGNRGYALAKNTALAVLLEFQPLYNRIVWLNPPNLLGKEDPALVRGELDGHVVPGMIHRAFQAAKAGYSGVGPHPGSADHSRDFSTADHAAECAVRIAEDASPEVVRDSRGRALKSSEGLDVRAVVENLPPQYLDVRFATLDVEIAHALRVLVDTEGVLPNQPVWPLGFQSADSTGAPKTKRTRFSDLAMQTRLLCSPRYPLEKTIADMVNQYHVAHPNWHSHDNGH